MEEVVSRARKEAAEEIRAHLVALRGGAPFFSSSDANTLDRWLDEGRTVAEICTALERAAEARRKKRSRVPLSLRHARAHLGKTMRGAFAGVASPEPAATEPAATEPEAHPLKPMVDALVERARRDPRPMRLKTLAAELFVLPPERGEELVRDGLRCIRSFLLDSWNDLPDHERARRIEQARGMLLEQRLTDDEATLVKLSEELARDELRAEYPMLSAASLLELVPR